MRELGGFKTNSEPSGVLVQGVGNTREQGRVFGSCVASISEKPMLAALQQCQSQGQAGDAARTERRGG